jgi:hypothetical protein
MIQLIQAPGIQVLQKSSRVVPPSSPDEAGTEPIEIAYWSSGHQSNQGSRTVPLHRGSPGPFPWRSSQPS